MAAVVYRVIVRRDPGRFRVTPGSRTPPPHLGGARARGDFALVRIPRPDGVGRFALLSLAEELPSSAPMKSPRTPLADNQGMYGRSQSGQPLSGRDPELGEILQPCGRLPVAVMPNWLRM